MKRLFLASLLGLAVAQTSAFAQADKKEAEKTDEKKEAAKPEKTDVKEVAVIKTTEGEMVVEFWPDVAP